MGKDFKLEEIRKYISKSDRVSICMLETLNYSNYESIEEAPHSYDKFYVYGIGVIMSEFDSGNLLEDCIEVMVSEKPRSEVIEQDKKDCSICL